MAYTSWGTRKALGKRYSNDPALIAELERLRYQYGLAPQREAAATQKEQFSDTMAFNREQSVVSQREAALNRAQQEEANRQAGQASMVGTAGNLATNAAVLRAMTKGKDQPFFGGLLGGGGTQKPASVSMTQYSPQQIKAQGGAYSQPSPTYTPQSSMGGGVDAPQYRLPYSVAPATIDTTLSAGGYGGGTGAIGGASYQMPAFAAETSAGTGAIGGASFNVPEIGASTMSSGGTSLGSSVGSGIASNVLPAAGWLGAGKLAGQIGGGLLENAAGRGESNVVSQFGRTIQEPTRGIGRPWAEEILDEDTNETAQDVMDVLDPIGHVLKQAGTVICTELHRQGYLTDEQYEKDAKFGRMQDLETMIGYRSWAVYVAEAMRKSKVVTWLIRPFAMAWAKNMCGEKNRLGSALNKIGIPFCRFLGRLKLKAVEA